jgi:DNA-binding CsgD family transcriptional regulator
MADKNIHNLTHRENEIVELLGQGFNTRGIAVSLGIKYYTVRKHRCNILLKLGLHDAAQLAVYAVDVSQHHMLKKTYFFIELGNAECAPKTSCPCGYQRQNQQAHCQRTAH